jgi:hypothetical protein
MVRPIIEAKSYVAEIGKSMKARGLTQLGMWLAVLENFRIDRDGLALSARK